MFFLDENALPTWFWFFLVLPHFTSSLVNFLSVCSRGSGVACGPRDERSRGKIVCRTFSYYYSTEDDALCERAAFVVFRCVVFSLFAFSHRGDVFRKHGFACGTGRRLFIACCCEYTHPAEMSLLGYFFFFFTVRTLFFQCCRCFVVPFFPYGTMLTAVRDHRYTLGPPSFSPSLMCCLWAPVASTLMHPAETSLLGCLFFHRRYVHIYIAFCGYFVVPFPPLINAMLTAQQQFAAIH